MGEQGSHRAETQYPEEGAPALELRKALPSEWNSILQGRGADISEGALQSKLELNAEY